MQLQFYILISIITLRILTRVKMGKVMQLKNLQEPVYQMAH